MKFRFFKKEKHSIAEVAIKSVAPIGDETDNQKKKPARKSKEDADNVSHIAPTDTEYKRKEEVKKAISDTPTETGSEDSGIVPSLPSYSGFLPPPPPEDKLDDEDELSEEEKCIKDFTETVNDSENTSEPDTPTNENEAEKELVYTTCIPTSNPKTETENKAPKSKKSENKKEQNDSSDTDEEDIYDTVAEKLSNNPEDDMDSDTEPIYATIEHDWSEVSSEVPPQIMLSDYSDEVMSFSRSESEIPITDMRKSSTLDPRGYRKTSAFEPPVHLREQRKSSTLEPAVMRAKTPRIQERINHREKVSKSMISEDTLRRSQGQAMGPRQTGSVEHLLEQQRSPAKFGSLDRMLMQRQQQELRIRKDNPQYFVIHLDVRLYIPKDVVMGFKNGNLLVQARRIKETRFGTDIHQLKRSFRLPYGTRSDEIVVNIKDGIMKIERSLNNKLAVARPYSPSNSSGYSS